MSTEGIPYRSIARIVRYLWRDEERDFECHKDGSPEKGNHIFLDLVAVKGWLDKHSKGGGQ